MSVLRVLANNPDLATARDMPKWEDNRKLKISLIFSKQSAFQNFFKKVCVCVWCMYEYISRVA
jgi:hypothetical protein